MKLNLLITNPGADPMMLVQMAQLHLPLLHTLLWSHFRMFDRAGAGQPYYRRFISKNVELGDQLNFDCTLPVTINYKKPISARKLSEYIIKCITEYVDYIKSDEYSEKLGKPTEKGWLFKYNGHYDKQYDILYFPTPIPYYSDFVPSTHISCAFSSMIDCLISCLKKNP